MNCSVVTTFHKDNCKRAYCECSEEEGMNIKERYFQMSGKIEGEKISYYSNVNVEEKCFIIMEREKEKIFHIG